MKKYQFIIFCLLFLLVMSMASAASAGRIYIKPSDAKLKKWLDVLASPPLTIVVPPSSVCLPETVGKVRGLLIGVNQYRAPLTLAGSVNDVRLLEGAIKDRYPDAQLDLRLDDKANKAGIVDGLQKLLQESQCGDFVWVHYSGFGGKAEWFMPQESEGYKEPAALSLLKEKGIILPAESDDQIVAGGDAFLGGKANPENILRAEDLSQWLTAIRNRGAFVFVSIDTCSAATLGLLDQSNATGQLHLWTWQGLSKKGAETVFAEPERTNLLLPSAGGMAVFYATNTVGAAVEAIFPKEGKDQKTLGQFTFSLGSALKMAPPEATIRMVAKATGELFKNLLSPSSEIVTSLPVFLSTDPDKSFLSPTGRAEKKRSDTSISITAPSSSRGGIRLPNPETVIVGRLEQPEQIFHAMLNGHPLSFDSTGLFRADARLKPGENELTIHTFYRDYSHAVKQVPVIVEGSLEAIRGTGRQFAMIIANEKYDGSGFQNLQTPLADGQALKKILEERYGFRTRITAPDGSGRDLFLLNATRDQILATLNSLPNLLGPDDSLLVYYAGHGEDIEILRKSYWVPVDGRKGNGLQHTWISADDITSSLRLLPVRHILVVSDSCYAGGLTRSGGAGGRSENEEHSRYIENMFKRASRVLISSGGVEPVADGGGDGHSVFARALINGLTTVDDPVFTAEELFVKHIKAPVVGKSQQIPQYLPLETNSGHEVGDFVFRRQGLKISSL